MYKIFKSLLFMVWLLDIFNVNVSSVPWLTWLQPLLVDGNFLDGWAWFILWMFLPSTDLRFKLNKEDK